MQKPILILAACTTLVAMFDFAMSDSAVAQDGGVVRAEPVIVTASRLPKVGSDLAASTTVITRDEIDESRPADAIDLLRRVPGIHVDQPGGRGGTSSIYMRGADPNYTRVMVDGVPLNDPTNSRGGSFDPSSIDLSAVERVEIVRGPLSSVQGADAIAGTINFITGSGADEPSLSGASTVGGHGLRTASAQARGPIGEIGDIALNASYVDDGDAIEGSSYHGKTASAKAQFSASETSTLEIVSRIAQSDSSSFPDDSGGPAFAVRRLTDERDAMEASLGARLENEHSQRWTWIVEADAYRHWEDFDSPGVAPGIRNAFGIPVNASESTYERVDLRQINRLTFDENFEAALGADLTRESGVSDSLLVLGGPSYSRFKLDRRNIGLFAEGDWTVMPGWQLQAGLRYDNPENFGSKTSGSVGTVYLLDATNTRLRASWREGFKLPSFFALGNAIVGDPTLRPETSESFEAGFDQPFTVADAEFGATLFRNRYFDTIDFDDATNRLVNRSKVVSWGAEATAGWRPAEAWDLGVHMSFVDTDIRDTNEELRNRPKWRGGAHATWRATESVSLNAQFLYVGSALDSSIPTGDVKLDNYTRVDVAVNWTVSPGLEVAGAIDNLFDESYQEAVGFEAPGVTPRVTVRVTF